LCRGKCIDSKIKNSTFWERCLSLRCSSDS